MHTCIYVDSYYIYLLNNNLSIKSDALLMYYLLAVQICWFEFGNGRQNHSLKWCSAFINFMIRYVDK